jgi:hypothetical protein
LIGLLLAGDESHCRRKITVGDRDAGVGTGSQRRRDSRHDFEGDMVSCQLLGFLGQSPENQRVAAFESHDDLASSCPSTNSRLISGWLARRSARTPSQANQFRSLRACRKIWGLTK